MKISDKVEWSSQAGSHWKTKQGEVVAIVPKGKTPGALDNWFELAQDRSTGPIDPRSFSRNHESYLVLVGRTLYWPRASGLRSSNAEAHASATEGRR